MAKGEGPFQDPKDDEPKAKFNERFYDRDVEETPKSRQPVVAPRRY
jgi:hypothetical protein